MKYRQARCSGGGGGWQPCDWVQTVPALTDYFARKPGFTDGLDAAIEEHIAPTRVRNERGLAWPHVVYVIEVHL